MATSDWEAGRFAQSMENARAWGKNRLQSCNLREKDINDELKGIIRSLLRQPDGGALFILFGYTHETIVPALQRSFSHGEPVEFTTQLYVPEDSPELVMDRKLRNGEAVDDLVLARDRLFKDILNKGIRRFSKGRELAMYMLKNEDAMNGILRFVNTRSLEAIRELCEGRVDTFRVWQESPYSISL